MREKIRHVPIPLSGVMLGFAALGNYLKSSSALLWGLMECTALFLLVLLILKFLMFPRGKRQPTWAMRLLPERQAHFPWD